MHATKIRRKQWEFAALWFLLAASLAAAPVWCQSPAPAQNSVTSKTQGNVSLTLYNSNFGLVRETRQVRLPAGTVRLAFEDVPSSIEPATVHLTPPAGLDVLDLSYEYDLLSPQRLLEKYLGKQITLIFRGQQGGTTRESDVKAVLLSTNGPVWQIGNEIVTGIRPDGYRFPELPQGLYSNPTLLWTLRSAAAAQQSLNVSYLADQMNWQASYVLSLTPDGHHGSLDGWVRLTNNSGASFQDASLSLVAGQVHRVTARPRPVAMMEGAKAAGVAGGALQQFTQEATGEYHLYRLSRRVNLPNNTSRQISLLSAASVPVTQTYVVQGSSNIFRTRLPQATPSPEGVQVFLSFPNDAASGLGRPLPAGAVRVYQPDSQGNLIMLGEDSIRHTPKDETAKLNIGNAFDVTSERRQTDFRIISPRVHESAFEITLRNHKSEPVTVQVREPVGGSWEVVQSNFPAKKPSAFILEFDVPVPAGGDATLTYRVRVTD